MKAILHASYSLDPFDLRILHVAFWFEQADTGRIFFRSRVKHLLKAPGAAARARGFLEGGLRHLRRTAKLMEGLEIIEERVVEGEQCRS